MNENENWVCGVSGEPINVGDKYVVETIAPENAEQKPYERKVKLGHVVLAKNEENEEVPVDESLVQTRTA